jgi:hypothetical protein
LPRWLWNKRKLRTTQKLGPPFVQVPIYSFYSQVLTFRLQDYARKAFMAYLGFERYGEAQRFSPPSPTELLNFEVSGLAGPRLRDENGKVSLRLDWDNAHSTPWNKAALQLLFAEYKKNVNLAVSCDREPLFPPRSDTYLLDNLTSTFVKLRTEYRKTYRRFDQGRFETDAEVQHRIESQKEVTLRRERVRCRKIAVRSSDVPDCPPVLITITAVPQTCAHR